MSPPPLPNWDSWSRSIAPLLAVFPLPAVIVSGQGDLFLKNRLWEEMAAEWGVAEGVSEPVPEFPGMKRWVEESSRASLYGHFLAAAFGEDEEGLQEITRALAQGETFDKTCTFRCHGRRRYLRFRMASFEVSDLAGDGQGVAPRLLLVTHEDVTRQIRMEKDLKESHSLFQQAIESVQDGIFLYDREGRYVMVNSVYASALGYTVEELKGRTYHEIFKPEVVRQVQEQNLIVEATGQTLSFENIYDTTSGPRHVHISKGVYRNHRNEVVGIFGIARDITEWKQIREKLEKSAHHFQALIENSADRVVLLSPKGTIRYVSPSSKAILGYDQEELLNGDFFQRVHPDDITPFRKVFNRLLETGGTIVHQYRTFHKEGRWIWMEARLTYMVNDPSVGAVVVNDRDITERKNAESELERYEDIVESTYEGVVTLDLEGRITTWNPAAEQIFGYSRREILGRPFAELVYETDLPEYDSIREKIYKGKRAREFEWVLRGKNDQPIDAALRASPLRSREGKISGILIIIADLTDRRCLEREILEISDREKERIAQDLHDDLCQLLIGITLASDRLARALEESRLPQYEESVNLTALVRQALDHTRRLSRGLSLVQLGEIGLVAALEQLVENTRKLFRAPCFFECEGTVAVENLETAKGLYRIAQEALHNAVKHSQATRIVLSLKNNRDSVIVSVTDNGVGIAETQSRVKEGPESGGFGMHGMEYRARAVGAVLDIRRNREGGTTVQCRISKRKCQG